MVYGGDIKKHRKFFAGIGISQLFYFTNKRFNVCFFDLKPLERTKFVVLSHSLGEVSKYWYYLTIRSVIPYYNCKAINFVNCL